MRIMRMSVCVCGSIRRTTMGLAQRVVGRRALLNLCEPNNPPTHRANACSGLLSCVCVCSFAGRCVLVVCRCCANRTFGPAILCGRRLVNNVIVSSHCVNCCSSCDSSRTTTNPMTATTSPLPTSRKRMTMAATWRTATAARTANQRDGLGIARAR